MREGFPSRSIKRVIMTERVNIYQEILTDKEATEIAYKMLKSGITKKDLAEQILGVTKHTLYTRLKKQNWKRGEKAILILNS